MGISPGRLAVGIHGPPVLEEVGPGPPDCEVSGLGEAVVGEDGIDCANGASPLIRNNILTRLGNSGILCGPTSAARIINNTIAYNNPDAVAVESDSGKILVVNNIISNNRAGVDSEEPGMSIDYNDLWQNSAGNYVGTTPQGDNDTGTDPLFASVATEDFRLLKGSQCLDAGDPVELLTADYTDGSTLSVDAVTNINTGDRIWITDGTNLETDIVAAVTADTIVINGKLLNDYLVADNSYIFTDTSNAANEPSPHNTRIDMGAYGNTPEAEPQGSLCPGDFEPDGDVDAEDLARIAKDHGRKDCTPSTPCFGDFDGNGTVDDSDMATFASDFGSTDCLDDN